MLKKSILVIVFATGSLCLASGASVKSGETRKWIGEYEALVKKYDDAKFVDKVKLGDIIDRLLRTALQNSQALGLGAVDQQKFTEHIQNALNLNVNHAKKLVEEAKKIQEEIDKLKEENEAWLTAKGEEREKAQKK